MFSGRQEWGIYILFSQAPYDKSRPKTLAFIRLRNTSVFKNNRVNLRDIINGYETFCTLTPREQSED